MKATQAKSLTGEELQTLRQLFQRWALLMWPFFDGSSEASDAFSTYDFVYEDAARGHMNCETLEEIQKRIAKHGETNLKD